MRLAPAAPRAWPSPLPLGETGALELTQGALTDAEAKLLPRGCMTSVGRVLAPTRAAQAQDALRVVVSRMVVDTGQDGAGKRAVMARAVVELRRGARPLAIGTGTARLTSGTPTFRADGVEPAEVQRTLNAACEHAARALQAAPPALSPARRAALLQALGDPVATARLEAVVALGASLEEDVAPALAPLVMDPDPRVRRGVVAVLGDLCAVDAVEPVARQAELDVDLGVRVEAVGALNKMLACDPSQKARMRAVREAAAAQGRAPAVGIDENNALEEPPREVLEAP
jgi:hypothetical protein